MRRLLLLLFLGFLAASAGAPAWATESVLRVVTDDRGVAIGGYDAVAYFREGRAVRGAPDHVHRWSGAVWHFASAAARDLFAADPEAYAPQFGGWCAWAMSEDRLSPGDPRVWRIVAGRLYLNCSLEAQRAWEAELDANIARAEAVWARRRPIPPIPDR